MAFAVQPPHVLLWSCWIWICLILAFVRLVKAGANPECFPGRCPANAVEEGRVRRETLCFISLGLLGHAVPLVRLAEEMVTRGYDVTFISHDAVQELATAANLKFVSAGEMPLDQEELQLRLDRITRETSSFRSLLQIFNEVYLPLSLPLFQSLPYFIASVQPSLMIVDIAAIGAKDMAKQLNVPVLLNSPTNLFDMEGYPYNGPAWGSGYSINMTLAERCKNFLYPRLLSVALTPPFLQLNKVRWEMGMKPLESQDQVLEGSKILVNTAFGLEYPRALPPLIEMTGPLMPRCLEKELAKGVPPYVGQWLEGECGGSVCGKEDSGSGVIYIHLGNMPQIQTNMVQELTSALAPNLNSTNSSYRVLWILPQKQKRRLSSALPENFRIKILGRIPHIRLLAHPSIRLVISHCGMASAQEALYFGKPLLCIPFFADQFDVATRVVEAKAGLRIDKDKVTAEEIRGRVNELLNSPGFTERAMKVGEHLKAAGGVKAAASILESTLRLGDGHLITLDKKAAWHRAAMIDVFVVYSAVFGLLLVSFTLFFFSISSLLHIFAAKSSSIRLASSIEESSKAGALHGNKRRIAYSSNNNNTITDANDCWSPRNKQRQSFGTASSVSEGKHEGVFQFDEGCLGDLPTELGAAAAGAREGAGSGREGQSPRNGQDVERAGVVDE